MTVDPQFRALDPLRPRLKVQSQIAVLRCVVSSRFETLPDLGGGPFVFAAGLNVGRIGLGVPHHGCEEGDAFGEFEVAREDGGGGGDPVDYFCEVEGGVAA